MRLPRSEFERRSGLMCPLADRRNLRLRCCRLVKLRPAPVSGRRGRFSDKSPRRWAVSTLSSTAWPALFQAAPEGKSVHSTRPVAKLDWKPCTVRYWYPTHFCSRFNIAILERGRSLARTRRGRSPITRLAFIGVGRSWSNGDDTALCLSCLVGHIDPRGRQ